MLTRLTVKFLLPAVLLSGIANVSAAELIQHVARIAEAEAIDVVIDTRPLRNCRESSLQGARCLPVEDVLAPHHRLANWSGILWLLGSADLTGKEHILVVGEQAARRYFWAGLLTLAGQKQISVLQQPVSSVLAANTEIHSGSMRSTTRTQVYLQPMRTDLIILQNDLQQLLHDDAVLLDGRTEAEYFGTKIRAARGGHIPGASHSPLSDWYSDSGEPTLALDAPAPIIYAHNSFDGLVYFATVTAAGLSPRVYLSGWVDWAFNGYTKVDSVSYPQREGVAKPVTDPINTEPADNKSFDKNRIAVAALVAVGLLASTFYGGYRFAARAA